MRRTVIVAFALLVGLGCAHVAWGACTFNNFTPLPFNTQLAIGPTLYSILNANPQLWTVLGAARDAWSGTDAGGRIGNGNFPQSASDCPVVNGQSLAIQLGAMDFPSAVAAGSCPPLGSGRRLR